MRERPNSDIYTPVLPYESMGRMSRTINGEKIEISCSYKNMEAAIQALLKD